MSRATPGPGGPSGANFAAGCYDFFNMRHGYQSAIDDWIAAIGAEHVTTAGAALQEADTATFATTSRIPAILRPADREQVRECLRIANRSHRSALSR